MGTTYYIPMNNRNFSWFCMQIRIDCEFGDQKLYSYWTTGILGFLMILYFGTNNYMGPLFKNGPTKEILLTLDRNMGSEYGNWLRELIIVSAYLQHSDTDSFLYENCRYRLRYCGITNVIVFTIFCVSSFCPNTIGARWIAYCRIWTIKMISTSTLGESRKKKKTVMRYHKSVHFF